MTQQNPARRIGNGLLWAIGAVLCYIFNPSQQLLGLSWPAWGCYLAVGSYGALAGWFSTEYPRLGTISGVLMALGMLTACAVLIPGDPKIGQANKLVVLIAIAPGYCIYYAGKELLEPKVRSESPIAFNDPEWMGTPEGRTRRLKIIAAVFAGLIAMSVTYFALSQ